MVAAVAALTGALDEIPAPPLLRLLARPGRTGILSVLTPTRPVVVCIDDGAVTFAGPAELPAVRDALAAADTVAPASWERAERHWARGDASLAEALARDDAVTASALGAALHELAVDTVFELLVPSRAPFRFDEGGVHPLAVHPGHEVEALLADANARLQTWRMIADVIPTTALVVRAVDRLPPGTARVVVEREEWPVLMAVDGVRDVAAVITHTGLSALAVCRALHRLIALGVVEAHLPG